MSAPIIVTRYCIHRWVAKGVITKAGELDSQGQLVLGFGNCVPPGEHFGSIREARAAVKKKALAKREELKKQIAKLDRLLRKL